MIYHVSFWNPNIYGSEPWGEVEAKTKREAAEIAIKDKKNTKHRYRSKALTKHNPIIYSVYEKD